MPLNNPSPPGAALAEHGLSAAPSIGATTITLDRSIVPIVANQTFVAIDVFTTEC